MFAYLLALSLAAVPESKSPRPFGLEWGTPVTMASAKLAERLTPFEYREFPMFKGSFAGYRDAVVELMGDDKGLVGVLIRIPPQGEVYRSITWREMVEKVTDSYGKPEKLVLPTNDTAKAAKLLKERAERNQRPTSKALAEWWDLVAKEDRGPYWLDHKINTGEWKPEAIWTFGDGSTTKIFTIPFDERLPTAAIVFFGSDRLDSYLKTLGSEPDF